MGRPCRPLPATFVRAVRELVARGWSYGDLAARVARLGMIAPRSRTQIPARTVRQVVKLAFAGHTPGDVASRTGVGVGHVRDILRGRGKRARRILAQETLAFAPADAFDLDRDEQ